MIELIIISILLLIRTGSLLRTLVPTIIELVFYMLDFDGHIGWRGKYAIYWKNWNDPHIKLGNPIYVPLSLVQWVFDTLSIILLIYLFPLEFLLSLFN